MGTILTYGAVNTPPNGIWVNPKSNGSPCRHHPGGVGCGEPIDIGSGNQFEQVADYQTVGQNPLSFVRYYNSMAVPDTFAVTEGGNWRSNYDRYLHIISASGVQAERADGQIVNFTLVGSTWTPDTDVNLILTNSGSTWTLTDGDDTVETYTATSGKAVLNTIKLRNGYTQTLNYTSGVLTSVSDSYSRSLAFTYTSGLMTRVTTPDSLTLTFGYTAVGAAGHELTSVTYNTSPTTNQTYIYGNANYPYALTGIQDEDGNRYVTWTYDNFGRATSSQFGTGTTTDGLTTITYDDTTGNRTVTGPLGIAETYKFTALQGVPKVTEIDRAANGTVAAATRTFTYDANGYLASATDWDGNLATYVNNAQGNPTSIVEASGSTVARTTTVTYDTTWTQLPHIVVTDGLTTTNNYDTTTGNLLTKVLTDTTSQTSPYPTHGQTRTTTYTYTATGQLHTVLLPRLDVTAMTTYNYTGGTLTSIVDALSHTTTVNTYTGGGLPTKITDPNSVVTNLAYDTRLRLHTSGLVTGAGTLTTTWDHDAAGNLTKLTLADGSYLSYTYDNAHRVYKITNILGETQNLTLDAMGNITQSLWKNATPTTTRQHNATFDALGRLATDVGGMSQTTTFGYDSQGNVTSIETPLTWTTTQSFDALNRLSVQTDPYTHTTSYTYDAHDRPLTVTDPNGHSSSYVYDGFGEAIQRIIPDSNRVIYHYDADGNMYYMSDFLSQVTQLTFDALDRPLTRTYPADSTMNVAFTYDQTGHGFGINRLTSLTDQVGSLSRNYDERGNVTSDGRTIASTLYTTTYTYDNVSRVATITYPGAGWLVTFGHDTAGQLVGVSTTQPAHASQLLAYSGSYMPFGPLKALTWRNGVVDARTFDLDYRINNLTDQDSPTTFQNLTYAFDADNNVHTITDALNAANSQALGYDHLERLTSAVSGTGGYGTLGYTYDNNGNRLTENTTNYSIAVTNNRLTAVGSTSVSTNNTGTVSAIGTTNTFGYNKANQMASATISGTATAYTYDAFGNRLTAQVGTSTPSLYQYDQAGHLLTETNGGVETDYVYLNDMPVAVMQPAAATISYIHPDRLGTPQLATSLSRANVWNTTYRPFGTTGTVTTTITQNLRLPGQYADATGFYHNGYRDYYPLYGRYLESDPIGLAAGTNTYSYVWNNPFKYTDRLGLCLEDACIGEAIIAYEAVEALSAGAADVAALLEDAEEGAAAEGAAGGDVGLPVAQSPPAAAAPTETVPEGAQCRISGDPQSAATGPALAKQLSAQSAFTPEGNLSPEAISNAQNILDSGKLGNPNIPEGFEKYSTQVYQSPSGPMQVRFYQNPETGEIYYGLDYKTVFTGGKVGQ